MIKSIFLITATFLITTLNLQAQLFHEDYDWEENPSITPLTDSLAKEPSVTTKDFRSIEFYYSAQEQNMFEYLTIHSKVVVNTDEGVEDNNRVYIPMGNALELVNAKARVIKPSGEIILLDESNIKSAEDLNEEGSYTFFPIDGAVKHAEIEYLITTKSYAEFDGSRLTYQFSEWKLNCEFQLISPENLTMSFLTHGDFEEPTLDSIANERIKYSTQIDSLPPLYNEPFAATGAYRSRIIYKLEGVNGGSNAVNYGDVSENFWSNTHPELSKKDIKTIDKILKSDINLSKLSNEAEKIRAIEDYIKTHFFVSSQASSSDIDAALSLHYTSKLGLSKLFCAFLDRASINYEIGITTDRTDLKFDEQFESHVFLQDVFLYFPSIKDYVIVHDFSARVGLIPYEFSHNYGLFIKGVTVGDYSTGVGKIKFIQELPASKTVSTIELHVNLNENLEEPVIALKRSFTGYSAQSLQPFYSVMEEESITEVNQDMIKLTGENTEVKSVSVHNTNPEDVNVKPLVYEGEIIYRDLIQNAGDKYLFNIGELIGPQVPLYQEHKRVLPVENDYNRTYTRTLNITLPDGYTIKNPEDLNFNFNELKGTALFNSSYELNEKTLTVSVSEVYDQLVYPLEDYEAYRKVINAAADFNKVVLILAPM